MRAFAGAALCLTLAAGCGDDDGPPIEDDMGPVVGDGGGMDGGPSTRCSEDSDCDDGVACTLDSCDERNCFNTTTDSMCEDDNPCTADVCSDTEDCTNGVVADGTACTDPGGAAGTCTAGVCSSGCTSDADCDDGVACTTTTCDTDTGICGAPTLDDAACDDGAGCTVDSCTTSGCNNAMAADGTDCTSVGGATGTCMSGACVTGCESDAECDDGIDCTADVCDTTIGACSNTPEDTMCDDGVDCTSDTCSAATGCVATPVNTACDDGIGCTSDTCDATAGCMFTPVDMACDDSVDCTVDVCSPTSDCSRTPDDAECDDMNSCTANTCDMTGGCGTTNVVGGTPCMDGAGANGLCDGAGTCQVACTTDADCADADMCNGAETCDTSDGTCVAGTPLSCDDGVDCTDDSCAMATGCSNVANDANCDDGNPCTSGSCDMTGDCSQTNLADTTACTVGGSTGQCQSGTCVIGCTGDAECDDGVDCTLDSCDLGTGTCVNSPRNGMCDDGVSCTVDRCRASGCQNLLRDARCDDSNDCTANMCTATGCMDTDVIDGTPCNDAAGDAGLCAAGSCSVECTSAADCQNGNACDGMETCSTNGQCRPGTALDCNDMDACTTDSCDMTAGCQNVAITCDDMTSCTTNDCNPAMGCEFTPVPANCDDGNECTAQVCTSMGGGDGCTNPPVVDGTSCMAGAGTCQSGVCTTTNPVGYRLDDLVLVDPHAILDTVVFGFITVCGDITNDDLSVGFGQTIPNLNGALNELVTMDGDGDTFVDFGYVLYFDDLDQGAGAMGNVRAVESNCTLPDPSDCTNAMGQDVPATYVVRRTGSCTPAAVANADTMTWPDGRNSDMQINRPTAGTNGCFETSEVTFDLEIVLQGTPVTIPLEDTVIAAQFADTTGTRITNGVLVGFLTEANADIDIMITDPVNLTVNLRDDVLPDGPGNHCTGHDGRDTWAGPDGMMGTADDEDGWWFMVNLTGRGAATLTGY